MTEKMDFYDAVGALIITFVLENILVTFFSKHFVLQFFQHLQQQIRLQLLRLQMPHRNIYFKLHFELVFKRHKHIRNLNTFTQWKTQRKTFANGMLCSSLSNNSTKKLS